MLRVISYRNSRRCLFYLKGSELPSPRDSLGNLPVVPLPVPQCMMDAMPVPLPKDPSGTGASISHGEGTAQPPGGTENRPLNRAEVLEVPGTWRLGGGCPPLNSSFHLSGAVGRYATLQPNLWEGCILNSFLKGKSC